MGWLVFLWEQNLVYTIDYLRTALANGALDALALVLSRQLWFVLVVNPDGYAWNEHATMWNQPNGVGRRKNTRPGCATTADNGVDLNRNYDLCFQLDAKGSSTDVCGEDFGGPQAFSEPESRAIQQLVQQQQFRYQIVDDFGGKRIEYGVVVLKCMSACMFRVCRVCVSCVCLGWR